MLSLKDVCLQIEKVPLLSNINLQCESGEVTVLMGPNGAGKTSLLNVISKNYQASSGELEINGAAQASWAESELAKFMGVLPQYSSLDFPFLVKEVVLLGRTPHAAGKQIDAEIVQAALEKVDGSYLANRLYTRLSGGEKQRVQLARVLAQVWPSSWLGKPQDKASQHNQENLLMLLDEPSASLDLEHQQLLRRVVKEFAEQGGTVVMVMHDLNLAAMCADKMTFMTCGRIVANGSPQELLTPEKIKHVFGVDVDVIQHPSNDLPLVVV